MYDYKMMLMLPETSGSPSSWCILQGWPSRSRTRCPVDPIVEWGPGVSARFPDQWSCIKCSLHALPASMLTARLDNPRSINAQSGLWLANWNLLVPGLFGGCDLLSSPAPHCCLDFAFCNGLFSYFFQTLSLRSSLPARQIWPSGLQKNPFFHQDTHKLHKNITGSKTKAVQGVEHIL